LRAIELNGTAVEANRRAFLWGRRAAHDLNAVERAAAPALVEPPTHRLSRTLEEVIAKRVAHLMQYQNRAYAERYRRLVERVREAEASKAKGLGGLAEAVARSAHKLMAYKDEYEVARLYTDGAFLKQLQQQFEGDYRLEFHLAPPLVAERDPATGHLRKKAYGPWMLKAFAILARLKWLRGTMLDPFGRSEGRRRERAMIGDYERVVAKLTHDNHALTVDIQTLIASGCQQSELKRFAVVLGDAEDEGRNWGKARTLRPNRPIVGGS
jgi:indolepyruvate ferredoxin oxidoreductase